MYRKSLVDSDFNVPLKFEYDEFVLIPLKIDHVDLDYDAVMDNFGTDGLPLYPKHTREQNLIDLGYHQKEHQKRASFTYTILTTDQDECIGCVYIYPSDIDGSDAEIDAWVRNKYKSSEENILKGIRKWISSEWPFENPTFVF